MLALTFSEGKSVDAERHGWASQSPTRPDFSWEPWRVASVPWEMEHKVFLKRFSARKTFSLSFRLEAGWCRAIVPFYISSLACWARELAASPCLSSSFFISLLLQTHFFLPREEHPCQSLATGRSERGRAGSLPTQPPGTFTARDPPTFPVILRS